MNLSDEIRKCVAFVGYKPNHSAPKVVGTVFFLSRKIEGVELPIVFAVTAKHVIESIKQKLGYEVFLKLNTQGGDSEWFPTKLQDWIYHADDTSVDVAALVFDLGVTRRPLRRISRI